MGKITRCFGSKYKYKFAYITHETDAKQMLYHKPALKLLPQRYLSKIWSRVSPSFLKITDIGNSKTLGFVIHIPYIENNLDSVSFRSKSLKKIVKAIYTAKKKGCKTFALGQKALELTNDGFEIGSIIEGVSITSGYSLTAALTLEAVKYAAFYKSIDINKESIAIVGATTSLGELVAMLLAEEKKNLLLISNDMMKLIILQNKIIDTYGIQTQITNNLEYLKYNPIVVITECFDLTPASLAYNSVIYDVSEPRCTSRWMMDERPDVTIIDGGLVYTPRIDYGNKMDWQTEHTLSSMVEAMLMAKEGLQEDHVGESKTEHAKQMINIFFKHHREFSLAPFTSFGKIINISELLMNSAMQVVDSKIKSF